MKKILSIIFLICVVLLLGCTEKKEDLLVDLFKEYYASLKALPEDKWLYTTDTVRQWFDEKTGDGILQIKGDQSSGKWKEWDKEMNSNSYYDSLWFDENENAVKGYFYENNDFYDLIGKGPTKTLRTYWFNANNKIYEYLIYWIPEANTTTSEHLKPIQEWAMANDSSEINALYPNSRIVPSGENAKRWKVLLEKYNSVKD